MAQHWKYPTADPDEWAKSQDKYRGYIKARDGQTDEFAEFLGGAIAIFVFGVALFSLMYLGECSNR